MSGEKILVVDDETEIRDLITLYLIKNGFQAITAENGLQAIDLAHTQKPDLIILDILLPGLDGIEVCQILRKNNHVPILFLSCKSQDADKIQGLTVGGDDYITKPFSFGELVARVKSHLRRSHLANPIRTEENSLITYPGLVINLISHEVLVNNCPVDLAAKEFQLLALLTQNPNKIFSIDHLFQLLWDSHGDCRTVMTHMSNLRKKIEQDPSNPKYVRTIRNVGYKFIPPAP